MADNGSRFRGSRGNRISHDCHHIFHVEWLANRAKCAGADRFFEDIRRSVRGHENDARGRGKKAEMVKQCEIGRVRKLQIEQHDPDIMVLIQTGQRLASRARLNAHELAALAQADALQGLTGHRHQAAWAGY